MKIQAICLFTVGNLATLKSAKRLSYRETNLMLISKDFCREVNKIKGHTKHFCLACIYNSFNHIFQLFKMNSINVNIDLSFQQLLEVVKKLTPKEKLLFNDVLWTENMEIPAAHQTLVLGRIKMAKQNPERLMDWDEVSKKF